MAVSSPLCGEKKSKLLKDWEYLQERDTALHFCSDWYSGTDFLVCPCPYREKDVRYYARQKEGEAAGEYLPSTLWQD